MRVTLDIESGLLIRARHLAAQRGITLDALIEEELQLALQPHPRPARQPFALVTFGEGGLTPEAEAKGLHRALIETCYDA